MNRPVDVTDATFTDEVLSATGVVIVDFWAAWCGPCRLVAPVLEEIAAEYDVKVAKLDVDANPETAQTYAVMSIPTMLVFRDGQRLREVIGAKPKQALLHDLDGLLG